MSFVKQVITQGSQQLQSHAIKETVMDMTVVPVTEFKSKSPWHPTHPALWPGKRMHGLPTSLGYRIDEANHLGLMLHG